MPGYTALSGYIDSDRKRTSDNLLRLRKDLRARLPVRTNHSTLLLATWNLRDFDSNKFGHGPRLPESIHYIAEILSAFDLVAGHVGSVSLGKDGGAMVAGGGANATTASVIARVRRWPDAMSMDRSAEAISATTRSETSCRPARLAKVGP